MFGWLHSKMQKSPAAQQPPAGLGQPDALLEDLRQRVPKYLADIDQGRLIHPACKRTLADASGDVASVWDHTRLEADAVCDGGARWRIRIADRSDPSDST